jgi:preprotein translocase subunit SecD
MVCKYRFSSKLTFLVWDSSKFRCSTLPGIAGIVLTMGTAVDANNIIIYERAKEELSRKIT